MDGRLIGADLGGTKLSVARMHEGTLEEHATVPTDKSSASALLEGIVRAVEPLVTADTVGLGIGVPAAVDFVTGEAKSGVNVPLTGVPVRRILGERLGIAVYVDNDANCAAIAEAHDDDGQLVVRDLVMYTIGTGVGGGLVLGGRPYRGATGAAAEMGHQLIGLDLERGAPPPSERFPQPGSLEALAAGRASLERPEQVDARREETIACRELLVERLRSGGLAPADSHANFVLVPLPVADDMAVTDRAVRRGILLRPGTDFGLPGHVRITVAPAPLMERVAEELLEACRAVADGAADEAAA